MAVVSFKSVNQASDFLRYARRNLLNGSRLVKYNVLNDSYTSDMIISEAVALVARMPAKLAAEMMVRSKATKGVRFNECKCERCGTLLTAPESVAAGIGPECMAK